MSALGACPLSEGRKRETEKRKRDVRDRYKEGKGVDAAKAKEKERVYEKRKRDGLSSLILPRKGKGGKSNSSKIGWREGGALGEKKEGGSSLKKRREKKRKGGNSHPVEAGPWGKRGVEKSLLYQILRDGGEGGEGTEFAALYNKKRKVRGMSLQQGGRGERKKGNRRSSK